MDLGSLLKYKREQKGLSLRDLSKILGYSHSYVCNVESGRKKPCLFALSCFIDALSMENDETDILMALVRSHSPKTQALAC